MRVSEKPRKSWNLEPRSFHSHKKQKKGRIVNVFAWNWHFWSGCTETTSNQLKMAAFNEYFLSGDDLKSIKAGFFFFDDSAKTSKDCYK